MMRDDPDLFDQLTRIHEREGRAILSLASVTLVRLGGHFGGGTVLHWADWSEGRGVLLLSGDILQVVPSGHVSFMWSYPNLIPLSAAKVQRMAKILEPFAFDTVYGSFSGRGQIDANGKQVVAASVARYIADQRDIVASTGDVRVTRDQAVGGASRSNVRTEHPGGQRRWLGLPAPNSV
jgi:hypothetical protein